MDLTIKKRSNIHFLSIIALIFALLCRAERKNSDYHDQSIKHHFQIRPQKRFNYNMNFFPINKPGELEAEEAGAVAKTHDDNELTYSESQSSVTPKLASILGSVYLFSSVCFILCLRGLSAPESSKRGNMLGMVGMAAAILVTLTQIKIGTNYIYFCAVLLSASLLGYIIAYRVNMVQVPQLVALFHSFVGLAAMLVGISNYHSVAYPKNGQLVHRIEIYLGEFIAAITFSGSIIAAAKLHDVIREVPFNLIGKHFVNLTIFIAVATFGFLFCLSRNSIRCSIYLYTSIFLSLILGTHLVLSIGGADMPVVISMLNSYSGFATAASGFMLDNYLLIIAGALIGSSGAILSYIMCRGMNRDFLSVILGGWEHSYETQPFVEGKIREISTEEVADELLSANRVLIVPGYGMAVSKCQNEISAISQILTSKGADVQFAIHPVAGRMPGHMNVLLAEADVPYNIVKEMEDVNPNISEVDVAIVVGANDTVNPAAHDAQSKIAGMPVIEVWRASKVVVMKRSMARGYAAIDNPLFYGENTRMLFGDAKSSATEILTSLSQKSRFMKKRNIQIDIETGLLPRRSKKVISKEFPPGIVTVGVLRHTTGKMEIVALAPSFVPKLREMSLRVIIQSLAGIEANFTDEEYIDAGGEIVKNEEDVINMSDILLKVSAPSDKLIDKIPKGKILISYIFPALNADLMRKLSEKGLTVFAVDEVPRITRAQKIDVKSAMQGLQGYRAVIEAFHSLPRLSKASTTAAGCVEAARVFVIGAGVAGLQAISTARGLGAQAFATDVRPGTKEEVESCGGNFLSIQWDDNKENVQNVRGRQEEFARAQQQLVERAIKDCDIVICTAAIPGKTSPKIITNDMIKAMRPGSVIVDLATEFGDQENGWGGNVECSPIDGEITVNGVTILGRSHIETHMPTQASELFSMNIVNLLDELGGGKNFIINLDDEVIREICVIQDGEIIWESQKQKNIIQKIETPSNISSQKLSEKIDTKNNIVSSEYFLIIFLICTAVVVGLCGTVLDALELKQITLFTLALIVGYYCVWSVIPALHTPLMSVTNALSGVIIIGSMLEYDGSILRPGVICAYVATFLSSLNIVGGFYVTTRMLDMFSI